MVDDGLFVSEASKSKRGAADPEQVGGKKVSERKEIL